MNIYLYDCWAVKSIGTVCINIHTCVPSYLYRQVCLASGHAVILLALAYSDSIRVCWRSTVSPVATLQSIDPDSCWDEKVVLFQRGLLCADSPVCLCDKPEPLVLSLPESCLADCIVFHFFAPLTMQNEDTIKKQLTLSQSNYFFCIMT